jgi:hypothetical protein
VTPADAKSLHVSKRVVRPDDPMAAVALGDALWVLSMLHTTNGDPPMRLYRIDPRASRISGRPLEVGRHLGWPVPGDGVVWLPAQDRQAVLAVRPASPAPAPALLPRGRPGARTGPLTPGILRARGLPPR